MTKVAILSDFRDWYDHAFDYLTPNYPVRGPHIWHRYAHGGMPKRAQLMWLESEGYRVPRHGRVDSLLFNHPEITQLVVYTDEWAHQGEGKLYLHSESALRYHSQCWASEFQRSVYNQRKPTTVRNLYIGAELFTYTMQSDHIWQSNVPSPVTNNPVKVSDFEHKGKSMVAQVVGLPVVALDWIPTSGYPLFIDFNSAPGFPEELREHLSPSEIYEYVKRWYEVRAQ